MTSNVPPAIPHRRSRRKDVHSVPLTVEDFEPPLTDADRHRIEAVDAFLRKHRWRLLFGRRGAGRERLLSELITIADVGF